MRYWIWTDIWWYHTMIIFDEREKTLKCKTDYATSTSDGSAGVGRCRLGRSWFKLGWQRNTNLFVALGRKGRSSTCFDPSYLLGLCLLARKISGRIFSVPELLSIFVLIIYIVSKNINRSFRSIVCDCWIAYIMSKEGVLERNEPGVGWAKRMFKLNGITLTTYSISDNVRAMKFYLQSESHKMIMPIYIYVYVHLYTFSFYPSILLLIRLSCAHRITLPCCVYHIISHHIISYHIISSKQREIWRNWSPSHWVKNCSRKFSRDLKRLERSIYLVSIDCSNSSVLPFHSCNSFHSVITFTFTTFTSIGYELWYNFLCLDHQYNCRNYHKKGGENKSIGGKRGKWGGSDGLDHIH